MDKIKVFSPATVSNVACGFDILGFPIDIIGDEMIVKKTKKKSLVISDISGYSVPYSIDKNVSTISAKKLMEYLILEIKVTEME